MKCVYYAHHLVDDVKIPPFYSLLRGIAVEDLWHDNNECEIGLSIKPADRLPGKDDIRKHCPYCYLLNQPWSPQGRLRLN